MKPVYKEIEHQLSESRREFWAADATINNLELRLAEMAAQLANTENKCAALADELDKWKQESSAWQVVAEKQLALAASAEQKIAELESLTAPQLPQSAPVVPAALPENDDDDGIDIDYLDQYEVYALGRTAGWNACRAAMLQCSEPVTDNTNQQFESLSRGDK